MAVNSSSRFLAQKNQIDYYYYMRKFLLCVSLFDKNAAGVFRFFPATLKDKTTRKIRKIPSDPRIKAHKQHREEIFSCNNM
jgi:hypothetical protein